MNILKRVNKGKGGTGPLSCSPLPPADPRIPGHTWNSGNRRNILKIWKRGNIGNRGQRWNILKSWTRGESVKRGTGLLDVLSFPTRGAPDPREKREREERDGRDGKMEQMEHIEHIEHVAYIGKRVTTTCTQLKGIDDKAEGVVTAPPGL